MSSLLTQLGQKVKAKLDNKFDKSGGLISGSVNISQSLQIGSYLTSSLPEAGTSGRIIYVTDGDGSGGPCIAVDDGTAWNDLPYFLDAREEEVGDYNHFLDGLSTP